ncbi:hypothetical protein [Catenovulum agarivorans]|uniref:hypothetical protein n=1 Tax=Catenovulum agarivorans TaxID=1172192 RepID=UPI0002E2A68A|nr:hypothetical protein [Catenovulum agarivorans]
MSMSLFVVLALEIEPNTNDLNAAAKELAYVVEYTPNVNLKKHSGFLPAKLESQDAGMETYSFAVSELPAPFKSLLPKQYSQGVVYQFKFGGNPIEAQTAFTTAIILSSKYNGITIEDQSGAILSPEQLAEALPFLLGM